jgi:hypothetical protein
LRRRGGRIKAARGKFKYRVDLSPCDVELLDEFPLWSLRLRGFRTQRTRASGYRETPMHRLVSPARFRRRGIWTNRESPCAYPPSIVSFLPRFDVGVTRKGLNKVRSSFRGSSRSAQGLCRHCGPKRPTNTNLQRRRHRLDLARSIGMPPDLTKKRGSKFIIITVIMNSEKRILTDKQG